jgi:hypothetical protein
LENLEDMTKDERRVRRRHHRGVGGGMLGALGGAGMGAIVAGPVGAAAGTIVGAAMGASIAWAADRGAQEAADRDSQLDIEIGVHGPDLGAPNLEHPPPTIGAFSREASGGGGGSEPVVAEGPILPPPD